MDMTKNNNEVDVDDILIASESQSLRQLPLIDDSSELRLTVESLSPRISALIDENETMLNNVLISSEMELFDHGTIRVAPSDLDDVHSEWKRLSLVEQTLSDELDLSTIGWALRENEVSDYPNNQSIDMVHQSNSSDGICSTEDCHLHSTFTSSTSDVATLILPSSNSSLSEDGNTLLSINNSSYHSRAYESNVGRLVTDKDSNGASLPTSFDLLLPLVNAIQAQFSSEDQGLPTISLLSTSDIQAYQDTPIFENYHDNKCSMEQRIQAAQSSLLFVREYVIPPSLSDLSSIYIGFNPNNDWMSHPCQDEKVDDESPPIRTVTIRVRPDSLCGAVMDAVHASVQNMGGEITKRQGGHLMATLPQLVLLADTEGDTISTNGNHGEKPSFRTDFSLPVIRLDIQLVSKIKSRESERVLLIRSFKIENPNKPTSSTQAQEIDMADIGYKFDNDEHRLMEAAISVQKLVGKGPSRQTDQMEMETEHRLSRHVQNITKQHRKTSQDHNRNRHRKISKSGTVQIPILKSNNLSYLLSSKCFVLHCLWELDCRGLSHSSLPFLPFCQFPALPSLCPHYISQLRDISQSSMNSSLLKSSKELDKFVSEDNFFTAAMSEILTPKFASYTVDLPSFPQPAPLEDFVSDFHSPEVRNPPWGHHVSEALNRLPNVLSSTNNVDTKNCKTEFEKARDAVYMISSAFQKQADEEFTERLTKKNLHIIDHLGKNQIFRRKMLESIEGLYSVNKIAAERADYFHRFATKVEGTSSRYANYERVPLLECNIIMGASSGLCMVTAFEMLLITQLIPVVGRRKYLLVSLTDIDVSVAPATNPSLRDPSTCLQSSSVISVTRASDSGGESHLFQFKPGIPPIRFKAFVDMLKELRNYENHLGIRISSSKGILSILAEQDSFIKAALGS